MATTELLSQLAGNGYCVLPSVFSAATIESARAEILNSVPLMGRTRDVSHSYHLAGFHRFPALMALHQLIAGDAKVNEFLTGYYNRASCYAIGLSDITINRSQHWHTDLLRGKYRDFLADGLAWKQSDASCIKVLVYLQPGKSLRIVPGSHLTPTPLDDAMLEDLAHSKGHERLELQAGDVVFMDIRALHRGSTDEEMGRPELADNPKILISTVFGSVNSALARAMQIGNAHRMMDWDAKFLGRGQAGES